MTKKILLNIFLIVILSKLCFAGVITDILNSGVGARPRALGNAFTGISDNSNSIAFNPAGIAKTQTFEVTTMQTKLLNTVDYKLYGTVIPTKYGVFGANYIFTVAPAGYGTTDKNSLATATPIGYSGSTLILSAAQSMNSFMKVSPSMGNLAFGVNLKIIRNFIGGVVDGNGFGIDSDIGFLLSNQNNFDFGLTAQNVFRRYIAWPSGNMDKLPAVLRLGGTYRPKGSALLFAMDSESSFSEQKPLLLHFGTEWKTTPNLSIRMGIDQKAIDKNSTTNNYTFGLGLKAFGFSFDYAYMMDGGQSELSNQYLSLSFSPASY